MDRRPRSAHPLHGRRAAARAGLVTVAVVAVAALGLPSASAAPATDGNGRSHVAAIRRPHNRAPSTPSDLGMSTPETVCAPSPTQTPIRSTAPTLRATLSDPDGDAVRGSFVLIDASTGRRIWAPPLTTARASGLQHTVTLPDGLLVDGGAYEWRVTAKDSAGRTSRTVRCAIVVDVTPPVVPEVSAVAGSAPAVYLEDQVGGGVGPAGEFSFDRGVSTDVVAFRYGLGDPADQMILLSGASSVTVTVVPMSAGPHVLTVQSVDAAGNVSAERHYRFIVASPSREALWALDEGAGTISADGGPAGDVPR